MATFEGKPEPIMWLSRDMCRICLRSASSSSVHVSVVAEKYREITDFVIQPTDVPQRLCFDCHNLVQELYDFVQTCKRTEETLRSLQESSKTEPDRMSEDNGFTQLIENCLFVDVKEEIPSDTENINFGCKVEYPEPKSESKTCSATKTAKEPRKKRFKCSECGKSYAYESVLEKHLETHRTNSGETVTVEKNYMCTECGKTLPNLRSLRKHQSKVHDESGSSVCDLCGKTIKTYLMQKHRRNMHSEQPYKEERIPCETCGKLIAKHNMSVHRKTHILVPLYERFLCDMCPTRSFKHKHDLKKHMRFHITGQRKTYPTAGNPTKGYQCSYCDKCFINDWLRKTHQRVTHEGAQKQVQCEFEGCTKMFHLTSQMRGHLRKVHSEGANFICPICGKSFKSKNYLQNHQYSHSKSYACPYKRCQRAYAHGYLLHDHMRKVHPEFKMPPRGTKLYNVDLSVYLPPGVK